MCLARRLYAGIKSSDGSGGPCSRQTDAFKTPARGASRSKIVLELQTVYITILLLYNFEFTQC